MPLLTETRVTSPFGMRIHPVTKLKSFHTGVDLRANHIPFYAYDKGIVIYTGGNDIRGKYVVVKHSDVLYTYYLHLSAILVKQGEVVHRKQQLGVTGATGRVSGPHLHFEIRLRGEAVDPMIFSPISETQVKIDGKPYKAFYHHEDQLAYVEVREFAKKLGAKTEWTPKGSTVTSEILEDFEQLLEKYK